VDGKSIYRLEMIAGDRADVFVENNQDVIRRFMSSRKSQMSVCELIGDENPNAVGIETIEPGSAILYDDVLTIEKKVRIRYVTQRFDTKTGLPIFEQKPSLIPLPPHLSPSHTSIQKDEKPKTGNPMIAVAVVIGLILCAVALYFWTLPSAEALFSKGKEQFAATKFTEAVASFSKAIKRDTANAEFFDWRGKAFYELKNYESAAADFKEAARLAPDSAEYHSRLGGVYSDSLVKNYDGAVTAYTQAIKLDPNNTNHYVRRAGAHSGKKAHKAAIDDLTEAIRLAPDNALYYKNRGDAHISNKDVVSALADYRMAIQFDPSNGVYRIILEKAEQMLLEQEDTRDGQKYRAVRIGGKLWLAQNMNYRPQTGNSWCYDNNNSNCERYGRLYDWNAAKTACLSGWHLPSRKEWKDLLAAVGASSTAGKKLKVGPPDWNGTDEYKFSARPGGFRNEKGTFIYVGTGGSWWMATENNSRSLYMDYEYGEVFDVECDKSNGISVRCVMNER
jgi:uncharacterized protein (TIGR02145 family)